MHELGKLLVVSEVWRNVRVKVSEFFLGDLAVLVEVNGVHQLLENLGL